MPSSRSGPLPFAARLVRPPDVAGLPYDVICGPDGEPYMHRHYLVRTPELSIRFHHIVASDPGRDLHDHPWDFTSLLLSGGYEETRRDGVERFGPGDVIARRAEMAHRLDLVDGPVWTYVVTGRVRRAWGFHTADGWVHWSAYEGAGALA